MTTCRPLRYIYYATNFRLLLQLNALEQLDTRSDDTASRRAETVTIPLEVCKIDSTQSSELCMSLPDDCFHSKSGIKWWAPASLTADDTQRLNLNLVPLAVMQHMQRHCRRLIDEALTMTSGASIAGVLGF
jgi:hypothetical protein